MKRTLQIVFGIIGVIVIIGLTTEIWFRTQSVIFLITMTCVFPFAIVYMLTGRFIKRKRPVIAIVILAVIGGYGMLMAWGNQFNEPGTGFNAVEEGFLMNLSTEVIGAAIILLLLSISRNVGNVILFFLTIGVILMVEQATGATQDITLNLSTELLGSLLTTMVIYRFVERFDEKPKRSN